MPSRVCTTCNILKDEIDFYKRSDRPSGFTSSCKMCRKDEAKRKWTPRKQSSYKLKVNYGLTLDEYNSMLEDQDGVCAICNTVETAKSNAGYIKNLAVDHCHKTGKVRGLLCQDCNIGIGKLKDDINLLKKAEEYLRRDYD